MKSGPPPRPVRRGALVSVSGLLSTSVIPGASSGWSSRKFRKIETLLDAIEPKIEPVHPALDSDNRLFQRGHPALQLPHIVDDAIQLLIETPEIDKNDIVRVVGHSRLRYSAASTISGSPTSGITA
jgi:hypothetical protein